MRFMYIVTPTTTASPTPELRAAVQKLAEREIKAGRLIERGGLQSRTLGAQVRITDRKLGVIDGPFIETKEVIGGYAIFELRDKQEAVEKAVEFMQVHLDNMPGWEGTCEVRAFMTADFEGAACMVDARAAS